MHPPKSNVIWNNCGMFNRAWSGRYGVFIMRNGSFGIGVRGWLVGWCWNVIGRVMVVGKGVMVITNLTMSNRLLHRRRHRRGLLEHLHLGWRGRWLLIKQRVLTNLGGEIYIIFSSCDILVCDQRKCPSKAFGCVLHFYSCQKISSNLCLTTTTLSPSLTLTQ